MRPRLVHPEKVTVEQLVASTADPTFGEPTAQTKVPVELRAQVKLEQGQPLQLVAGGASATAQALGHLVFEQEALDAAGVVLREGDRITARAGGTPVNWRILRLEGHASYHGKPWHLWAFFGPEDR